MIVCMEFLREYHENEIRLRSSKRIEEEGLVPGRLTRPLSLLPAMLTHPCCSIIPEGSTLFSGSWREGCIGTGPFRLLRFEPEKLLELEANPDYWRTGLPKSDGLRFAFGVPPQEILSGFRSGDFTVATDLLPSDVATLRRDPTLAAHYAEMPTLSTYFLAMNSHSGAMTDPALRRQVLESVDVTRYESIIRLCCNIGSRC